MTTYWLSFADPDRPKGEQLLGVVIMESDYDGEGGLAEVLLRAWRERLNPGGEVQSVEFPDAAGRIAPRFQDRLLTREEALAVPPPMTAEEFEQGYAERSKLTVNELHQFGRYVERCDCGSEDCPGWAMGHPWEDAIIEDVMREAEGGTREGQG